MSENTHDRGNVEVLEQCLQGVLPGLGVVKEKASHEEAQLRPGHVRVVVIKGAEDEHISFASGIEGDGAITPLLPIGFDLFLVKPFPDQRDSAHDSAADLDAGKLVLQLKCRAAGNRQVKRCVEVADVRALCLLQCCEFTRLPGLSIACERGVVAEQVILWT